MKKYEYKEQAEIPSNTGRTTIDNQARKNFSQRASKGTLDVIKNKCCPYCHHKKFLLTGMQKCKCAKCKREVKV